MKDVRKTSSYKKNTQNKQRVSQAPKKKKRRKKNMSLYYFMIFVFVSSALVILSLTVFFKVEKITVSGSSTYSKEEIIAASGIRIGNNLIRTDTKKAEQDILNTLVNVDTVKIKRKLPSEIKIEVTPTVASAIVEYNGTYNVISKNGKVIEDKLSAPKSNLIVIVGYDPENVELNKVIKSKDENKDRIVKQLLEEFKELNFTNITKIDISDRMNIKFTYQDRIEVELGTSSELSYKVKFIKAIIDEKQMRISQEK